MFINLILAYIMTRFRGDWDSKLYFASMVRFRSHHFGSEAKNSNKLLFS